jgi:hypothetical protein
MKQEDTQPVPIGSIEVAQISSEVEKRRGEIEKALDDQVYALSDLAYTRGWEALKAVLERKIQEYSTLTSVNVEEMSLANIGLRFMVSSAIAQELQSIVNRVENAKKSVEEENDKNSKTDTGK